MDSKGQAFSVFKLLIAAVVAGAILVILFQVLGNIIDPAGQDPSAIAGSAVQTQINKEGSPAFKDVKFSIGTSLVAKAIANKSNAISEGRICVGVSDDMPNYADFSVGPDSGNDVGKFIQYNGNYNQVARLLVYCDNAEAVMGTVSGSETTLEDFSYDFSLPDISDCEFDGHSRSTACVVIVVPDA